VCHSIYSTGYVKQQSFAFGLSYYNQMQQHRNTSDALTLETFLLQLTPLLCSSLPHYISLYLIMFTASETEGSSGVGLSDRARQHYHEAPHTSRH
jgi:hypothetical protein